METNWTNVIVPTMLPGARRCAGTRFHFDDLFATVFTEPRGWNVIIQSALQYEEDGTPRSYWPEWHSVKWLLAQQAEDRIAFAYQYQNTPVRTTELGVSPELFIKGEVPETYDMIGVGIDLSAGISERNDYTVFTLAGDWGTSATSLISGACARWATSRRSRLSLSCWSNGTWSHCQDGS